MPVIEILSPKKKKWARRRPTFVTRRSRARKCRRVGNRRHRTRQGTRGPEPGRPPPLTGRRSAAEPATLARATAHAGRAARAATRGSRPAPRSATPRGRATSKPSSRAAAATASSAARRFASSRTTPPLPTSPLPTSNCGFTRRSASPPGPEDRLHGREHEPERDEREVAGDEVHPLAERRRVEEPRVLALAHDDARIPAQPRRGAGRSRRPPRRPSRRRAGGAGR